MYNHQRSNTAHHTNKKKNRISKYQIWQQKCFYYWSVPPRNIVLQRIANRKAVYL